MSEVEKIIKKLREKYGDEIIRKASEKVQIPRLSTGSLMLDLATNGGIPISRVTNIYGEASTGKSTLSYILVAQAQQHCFNCFKRKPHCQCKEFIPFKAIYIDVEGGFSPTMAKAVGVDLDSLDLMQPYYAEQVIDSITELIDKAGYNFVVLDSIAQMTPLKELESSAEDAKVGLLARLVNEFLRKLQSMLNKKIGFQKPTVILVNQIRETLDLYGEGITRPGGKGQLFISSLDIKLLKCSKKDMEFIDDPSPFSTLIRFVITKSKFSAPFTEGNFRLMLRDAPDGRKKGSIIEEEPIWTLIRHYQLLQPKEKGGYTFLGKDFRIQDDVKAYIKENLDEVKEKLKEVILNG